MLPGSKTLRPVTVVADVTRKNASTQEIGVVVAKGSFIKTVPRKIKVAKLLAITTGGEKESFFSIGTLPFIGCKIITTLILNRSPVNNLFETSG